MHLTVILSSNWHSPESDSSASNFLFCGSVEELDTSEALAHNLLSKLIIAEGAWKEKCK